MGTNPAIARSLFAVVLTACVGMVSVPDGASDVITEAPPTFRCGLDDPAPRELPRLSRNQYVSAVRALYADALGGQLDDVWADGMAALEQIPEEATDREQPFESMSQAVTSFHVSAYATVGLALAKAATSTDARLAAVLRCDGASDDACVDAFLRRAGRLAYRHPLSDDEIAFLRTVYDAEGIDPDGVRDVLAVLVQMPQFVYRLEHGDESVDGEIFPLTRYEVATRLALFFYGAVPDATLLDEVQATDLSDDAEYAALVERMLEDPRSDVGLEQLATGWLRLDEVAEFDLVGTPIYDAFAGDVVAADALSQAMRREVIDSLVYHAHRGDGVRAWLESPYSFARSEVLASIYGVPVWDGESEPPTFPEGERAGLLTRAAFLANRTHKTRPIMRGVLIREMLLCDELPEPPPDAANAMLDIPDGTLMTTRETVERLTEVGGTSCAGCHIQAINGLGFATERYDALGRLRDTESFYDEDGSVIGELPIDARAVPRVRISDPRRIDGATELPGIIMDSGKLEACIARQMIRFAYARHEDLEADGCRMEAARIALSAEDGTLMDALRSIALDPSFRQGTTRPLPETTEDM